jgi:hypothetical protein
MKEHIQNIINNTISIRKKDSESTAIKICEKLYEHPVERKIAETGLMLYDVLMQGDALKKQGKLKHSAEIYRNFYKHNERWLKQLFPTSSDNGLIKTDAMLDIARIFLIIGKDICSIEHTLTK